MPAKILEPEMQRTQVNCSMPIKINKLLTERAKQLGMKKSKFMRIAVMEKLERDLAANSDS